MVRLLVPALLLGLATSAKADIDISVPYIPVFRPIGPSILGSMIKVHGVLDVDPDGTVKGVTDFRDISVSEYIDAVLQAELVLITESFPV